MNSKLKNEILHLYKLDSDYFSTRIIELFEEGKYYPHQLDQFLLACEDVLLFLYSKLVEAQTTEYNKLKLLIDKAEKAGNTTEKDRWQYNLNYLQKGAYKNEIFIKLKTDESDEYKFFFHQLLDMEYLIELAGDKLKLKYLTFPAKKGKTRTESLFTSETAENFFLKIYNNVDLRKKTYSTFFAYIFKFMKEDKMISDEVYASEFITYINNLGDIEIKALSGINRSISSSKAAKQKYRELKREFF